MSDYIELTTDGRVTTLKINRPERKNAITQEMYADMASALSKYSEDTSIRSLIITGTGEYFTSGNDLGDFAIGEPGELPPVARFLNALRDCPKPIIAAVNGHAIGIGLTMLLHCDLVLAARDSSFSAPFIKVGVVPEAGSSLLLPRSVGMAIANDIILTGRTLSVEEALDFGLIARILDSNIMMKKVREIARQISQSAPDALKRSKELIRNQNAEIKQQMVLEGQAFAAQLKSSEFTECVNAILEKRDAVFP
ncbi:MAG: enoyl-CoA hydratase-related protein [Pseudomonadota bacterium]